MQAAKIDINRTLCNGCGICVKVCPAQAFKLIAEQAELCGSCSFACDHCAAACPQAAITVQFKEEREAFDFSSFAEKRAVDHPEISPEALVAMMRARRSCRVYEKLPVEPRILEDLVKIGLTAPSGTNSQLWSFTIIDSRSKMLAFGKSIAAFFGTMNRRAENGWLRRFLKLCGQPELDIYYREYYESVKQALSQWHEEEVDRLFHGAQAAILIGAQPDSSCPQEDALLAAQNILLGAQALGLGSCLIGFAVEALRRDQKIKTALKIPAAEKIYAVIALGYPAISFPRPAGRRTVPVRWVE